VRRPDAGKSLSLRFDHGAEVVSTQGTLLLEIGSDGRQVVVGQSETGTEEVKELPACYPHGSAARVGAG
jgi:hypothetical protein